EGNPVLLDRQVQGEIGHGGVVEGAAEDGGTAFGPLDLVLFRVVGPGDGGAGLLGLDKGIGLELQGIQRVRQPPADNHLPFTEIGHDDAKQDDDGCVRDFAGVVGEGGGVGGGLVDVGGAGADGGDDAGTRAA